MIRVNISKKEIILYVSLPVETESPWRFFGWLNILTFAHEHSIHPILPAIPFRAIMIY